MQQNSEDKGFQSGGRSQLRWFLPSGFGSIEMPPEQDGLPADVGEVSYQLVPLRPGLELYKFAITLHSPVTFVSEVPTEQPYLWLDMTACATSIYKHGDNITGNVSGGHLYASMLRDPETEIQSASGLHQGTGLVISCGCLRDILQGQRLESPVDDFLNGKFDPHVAKLRPTDILRRIVSQISKNPYQGAMETIFLEAKAFEVLAEYLRILMGDTSSERSGRSRRYANAARDLIMADLTNPPRIEDVAKQVGLSQRRLNEIFREVFQASPPSVPDQLAFGTRPEIAGCRRTDGQAGGISSWLCPRQQLLPGLHPPLRPPANWAPRGVMPLNRQSP